MHFFPDKHVKLLKLQQQLLLINKIKMAIDEVVIENVTLFLCLWYNYLSETICH